MSSRVSPSPHLQHKPRLLVFVVAYEAETTIAAVLGRVPHVLGELYDVEVLAIDDSSSDATFERAEAAGPSLPFPLHVLFNPVNQGYGGNQKIGFHYAVEHGFDYVALLHGDGQYAPECLPDLVQPLRDGVADAVFGSRMLTRRAALQGGMPLYKWLGNQILTFVQNRLLRSRLSEFHSGYRVYAVAALKTVPFDLNNNGFHFDTEIIIQLLRAGRRIHELPIPTFYGDEICRVNGLRYAWNVVLASLKARAQDYALFYDPKFEVGERTEDARRCELKTGFESPHTLALQRIPAGARVLDVGGSGRFGALLRERGCHVVAVGGRAPDAGVELDGFVRHDFDHAGAFPVDVERFDYALLLDVIEHMRHPEAFVAHLKEAASCAPGVRVIVSTANIGFIVTRLMLLVGQFNYGRRGILDLTHTRLFTFASLRRLFEQAGFDVLEVRGVPAPFPLALGRGRVAHLLLRIHRLLIRLRAPLFAYQMFMVVQPRPSLEYLLRSARDYSAARSLANAPATARAPGQSSALTGAGRA